MITNSVSMKLWILRPIKDDYAPTSLWDPWYDKTFGMIVRAQDETAARQLAAARCAEEGPYAWLLEHHSTCVELGSEGGAGVIMVDHASA